MCKRFFQAYTDILRLFSLDQAPPKYDHIRELRAGYCPKNHADFKHLAPLWKNEEFFIKLPFKKNEDINPTKATHPGITPEDLQLARQECESLLQQGLIEPTKSDWACQAFYVKKDQRKKRGKKRLVIDYMPLNYFLQDDKFPIPNTMAQFSQLKGSKIYSKFDLKACF